VSWLLLAILIVPAAAAIAAATTKPRHAEVVTVVAAALVLPATIAIAFDVRNGATLVSIHGWLRLDSLGAIFLIGTSMLYAAAAVFSIGYLAAAKTQRRFARFARRYYAYLNVFGLTMLLVPIASDFGTLWIAVELTTIISALLVALDRTDAALEAAWKYVLIASAGLGIALLALIVLYAAGTGTLGHAYLPRYDSFTAHARALPATTVEAAFVLATVGFGTKVGFAPMHTWLPDAHSEAPTPVSALLSGALLANALYAILRFYQVCVLAGGAAFPRRVLLVFGVASLVVASLYVLRQESYKRLLAYSSVEHMGVIALGVGFGAPLAVAGAMLHVVNHAATKGLAFFGAGSILRRYDSKEVADVQGAGTILPWSGPIFLISAFALAGLPISGIFRSEFQIIVGGLAEPSYAWVAALIVLVNLTFMGVIWHAVRMVLSAAPASQEQGETSWWMTGTMLALLVLVVGLGLWVPGPFGELLHSAQMRLTSPST
jgi:hydrogenase-4 component F